MPGSLGTASLFVRLPTADFFRNLDRLQRQSTETFQRIEQAGQRLRGIGQGLSIGLTAPITALGALSLKAASDAEETAGKFDVVFQGIGDDAQDAADRLDESFGVSARAAQQLLADTGDLLTGFGFTRDSALDLSTQVNELAIDLASFTNYSGGAEGASNALTKALLGERESLKSLGIAILETDVQAQVLQNRQQGLTFETERQAEAFATLQIAQEQSHNAIGDFARTQDSFANQTRIMMAAVDDLRVSLGEGLIPILTPLVGRLADVAEGFASMSERTRTFVLVGGGLAAAIGPFLAGLGQFLILVPRVVAGFTAIRVAALALLGPAGIVIAGTAAVIGLIAAFRRMRSEGIDEAIEGVDAVKAALGGAQDRDSLRSAVQEIAEQLDEEARPEFVAFAQQAIATSEDIEEATQRITEAWARAANAREIATLERKITRVQEQIAGLEESAEMVRPRQADLGEGLRKWREEAEQWQRDNPLKSIEEMPRRIADSLEAQQRLFDETSGDVNYLNEQAMALSQTLTELEQSRNALIQGSTPAALTGAGQEATEVPDPGAGGPFEGSIQDAQTMTDLMTALGTATDDVNARFAALSTPTNELQNSLSAAEQRARLLEEAIRAVEQGDITGATGAQLDQLRSDLADTEAAIDRYQERLEDEPESSSIETTISSASTAAELMTRLDERLAGVRERFAAITTPANQFQMAIRQAQAEAALYEEARTAALSADIQDLTGGQFDWLTEQWENQISLAETFEQALENFGRMTGPGTAPEPYIPTPREPAVPTPAPTPPGGPLSPLGPDFIQGYRSDAAEIERITEEVLEPAWEWLSDTAVTAFGTARDAAIDFSTRFVESMARTRDISEIMAEWEEGLGFVELLGQYDSTLDTTARQANLTRQAIQALLELEGTDANVAEQLAVLQARLRELEDTGESAFTTITSRLQAFGEGIREAITNRFGSGIDRVEQGWQAFQNLNAELRIIDTQASVLGDSFDDATARVNAIETAIRNLVRNAGGQIGGVLQPVLDAMVARLLEARDAADDIKFTPAPLLADEPLGPPTAEEAGYGPDFDKPGGGDDDDEDALLPPEWWEQIQETNSALQNFGAALIQTAEERIPVLGAALNSFVDKLNTDGEKVGIAFDPMLALANIFQQLLSQMEPFTDLLDIVNEAFGAIAQIVGQLLAPVFKFLGMIVQTVANALIALVNLIMNIVTLGFWDEIERVGTEEEEPEREPIRTRPIEGGAFGTDRQLGYRPEVALTAGAATAPAAATSVLDGANILMGAAQNFDDTISRLEDKLDQIDRRTYNAANALR